ncbi:MAG: choloylglycine hydrolase family protein [Clostridia bacterium]|nr:choloylglycine hydrolase family protein [Clostridia bacterium]
MCTSLTLKTKDFYFCRSMDLDYHFGEQIVITPRRYNLTFKHERQTDNHHAIIGMATIKNDYPLYADGANEMGLCISAQNFRGNAKYEDATVAGALNLAPYEIIPYVLASFSSVAEVKKALSSLKIINTPFDKSTPTTPLHWHIADKNEACVLESTPQGVKIYENSVGIMTNNPPFPSQLKNLEKYAHLTPNQPPKVTTTLGLGMYGLEGDYTSPSRFVRLATLKKFTKTDQDEAPSLLTALRLMGTVAIPRGVTLTEKGAEHYTIYLAIINATKGIYYYQTSESPNLKCKSFHDCFLGSDKLEKYFL